MIKVENKEGGPPLSRAERGQWEDRQKRIAYPTQPMPEIKCVQ